MSMAGKTELYRRERWIMDDGRTEYYAPLSPSRKRQAEGRKGRAVCLVIGEFRDGDFVELAIVYMLQKIPT